MTEKDLKNLSLEDRVYYESLPKAMESTLAQIQQRIGAVAFGKIEGLLIGLYNIGHFAGGAEERAIQMPTNEMK